MSTKNRMYSLCIGALEDAERMGVNNAHHMAQRMALWAEAASLSKQQYKVFCLINKGGQFTCSELARKMNISSGHASVILTTLKAKGLVEGGGRSGANYCSSKFINP